MAKYEGTDHYLDPETGVYKNGYFIEWKNISQADMIQASMESFHQGDNTKFAALIRDNLRNLPASGPDETTPSKKRKRYPEDD